MALRRYQRRLESEMVSLSTAGRADGGGAQIHGQISAIAAAAAFGLPYVHLPLVKVEHSDGRSDEDWASDWNDYFGLAALGSGSLGDQETWVQLPRWTPVALSPPRRQGTVLAAPHFHDFTDVYPATLHRSRPGLRAAQANSRRTVGLWHFDAGLSSIAVHVRRGDVSSGQNAERYSSASRIAHLISLATASASTTRTEVVLFSQTEDEDLSQLADQDSRIRVCLEPDVFVVLDHLLAADVLVMAKSSLSYVAALLRSDRVVYEPFWHPPMPDWIVAK